MISLSEVSWRDIGSFTSIFISSLITCNFVMQPMKPCTHHGGDSEFPSSCWNKEGFAQKAASDDLLLHSQYNPRERCPKILCGSLDPGKHPAAGPFSLVQLPWIPPSSLQYASRESQTFSCSEHLVVPLPERALASLLAFLTFNLSTSSGLHSPNPLLIYFLMKNLGTEGLKFLHF